ncbi:MAG: amino acid ABC transporter substrate-binding protein [Pseudomonadota bacterium]
MRAMARLIACAVMMCGAATAQTIDKIRDSGQLAIGFRTDAPPLSFLNDQGQPDGYSPQLCEGLAGAIATALDLPDLEVNFVPVDTGDRFERVASGEIDLHCGAATITLTRREIVDFSIPTYVDGTSIMIPVGGAKGLRDLAGKTVGLRSNTTTEQAVETSYQNAGLDIEIERFTEHRLGVEALLSGEIDAYFADQSILMSYFLGGNLSDRMRILDDVLTIEKHGLALRRGDADFRQLVDTELSRMYTTGKVQQIFAKTLPGAKPGLGLRAMFLIAPTLP